MLPGPLYRLRAANQTLAAPALRLRRDLAAAAGREQAADRFEALFRERWGPAVIETGEPPALPPR